MFSPGTPSEYEVFRKKYSLLIDTLKTTDLYRYFVSEEIISLAENDDISAENNPIKRVKKFLGIITSALESGHVESFYLMLQVMASYGNRATKNLARTINDMLHCSVSDDNGKKIYNIFAGLMLITVLKSGWTVGPTRSHYV